MTKCALCKVRARTFCESDQAALCWDCDARVHGANFLVARHTRTLLCHACQCKTPWAASGAKLGHTVSVCDGCVNGVHRRTAGGEESGDHRDDDNMPDEDDETDRDEDEDDLVEDEDSAEGGGREEGEDGGSGGGAEDGDNQVVPWSSSPPPPHSSSSSDESVSRFYLGLMDGMCSLKRTRESSSYTDPPSPVIFYLISSSDLIVKSFAMNFF